MAEEKKEHKKHTHQVRSVAAEDGTVVHHHTMKAKKGDPHTEPERENVATSANAEEAGQHVADAMGQNEGAAPAAGEPEGGAPDEGAAPGAGAPPEPGE